MKTSYYQKVSPLGASIIELFNIDTSQDCITSIQTCEVVSGWDFVHCSILKYLWRLGVKSENIKPDCLKILDYIDLAIEDRSILIETLKIARMQVECLMLREP